MWKLPTVKQQAIQELGYGTNTKVITGYRDRLWRTKYGSNGQVFGDLDILSETWESGRYTTSQQGAIVNFIGGDLGQKLAKTQPPIAGNQFVNDFQKVFAGVESGYLNKSMVTNWIDSPYSRGAYACYLVGTMGRNLQARKGKEYGTYFLSASIVPSKHRAIWKVAAQLVRLWQRQLFRS